jgi:hypothetical protein
LRRFYSLDNFHSRPGWFSPEPAGHKDKQECLS